MLCSQGTIVWQQQTLKSTDLKLNIFFLTRGGGVDKKMLVMRMLVVLVVLMVLEELVVFVGGIFENGISPPKKFKKFIESIKKIFGTKKT